MKAVIDSDVLIDFLRGLDLGGRRDRSLRRPRIRIPYRT